MAPESPRLMDTAEQEQERTWLVSCHLKTLWNIDLGFVPYFSDFMLIISHIESNAYFDRNDNIF